MNLSIVLPSIILSMCVCTEFVRPPTNLDQYDAYGSLLAINDYIAILAQNDQEQFMVITNPFANDSHSCVLPYDTKQDSLVFLTRFVYSVAIGVKEDASQTRFAYIYENWQRDVFLTAVSLNPTADGCVEMASRIVHNITDFKMQEQAVVGMDPFGERAYALGTYFVVCIEIDTGIKTHFNTSILLNNQKNRGNLFFPKAFVVTENHSILAVGHNLTNLKFLPYLVVWNFLSLDAVSLSSTTELSNFNFGPSSVDITRHSTISISFLDELEVFIVGIPHLDMILFLSWDHTNARQEPSITRQFVSSQKGISFGKSVALLEDNTFAVLAHTQSTSPWSTSQIQIYSLDEKNLSHHPLVVYPNNQQPIPSLNFESPPYGILTLVSWKSHLGLVLDAGAALLLSVSPPGYYSSLTDENVSNIGIYTATPCIPGTARNTSSFGPCFLCPPDTKNNGSSGIECELCATNDSLICFRGSPIEIPFNTITNEEQFIPYPEPPELVVFDDILLQYIFTIMPNSPHCLVISPMFWAAIAIGIGLIIFIIMSLLIHCPRWKPRRVLLKKLFMRMDLIGEGQFWLGGLLTLAIVVLLIFICKFSISFTRLYPIETISWNTEMDLSCNTIVPNVKFTSALKLLSIVQHEDEKLMLKKLDEQNITLTIQFLGTGFLCDNLKMQQNFDQEHRVSSNDFNCSIDKKTSILSVSTPLPQHLIAIQYNLTGPYFIGALRVCLSGIPSFPDSSKFNLRELGMCQLFYTTNETLTLRPTIDIHMTKAINRTLGYHITDETIYSGIWIPKLIMTTLSDVLLFKKNGEYTRYLSTGVSLMIDVKEADFFVENTQEPIARYNEIVLRTILFAIVTLELFGLFFLLIKLIIMPPVKSIRRCFFSSKDRSALGNEDQIYLTKFAQMSANEIPNKHHLSTNTMDTVVTLM